MKLITQIPPQKMGSLVANKDPLVTGKMLEHLQHNNRQQACMLSGQLDWLHNERVPLLTH